MSPEHSPYLRPQPYETPRVLPESLPAELRQVSQWICWRYVAQDGDKKPDKQPVNPWNLHNAGVHWPNTWSTFAHAYMTYSVYRQRGIAGIGFVLTADDPFVGLDLDNCLRDEFITSTAYAVISQLATYTEVSPSGKGLRALVKNSDFTANHKRAEIEIYSHGRFLTFTGQHYPATPKEIRQVESTELQRLFPDRAEEPAVIRTVNRHASQSEKPDELWERIFQHDQYGEAHRQRFLGNTSVDQGDHSLAVIRLLNCLARWTDGDSSQMRAMMLLSPLANEKWFSKRGKGDWLDYQIRDAITFVGSSKQGK